jgi:hypothetical protein
MFINLLVLITRILAFQYVQKELISMEFNLIVSLVMKNVLPVQCFQIIALLVL